MSEHVVPVRLYVTVWALLLALTAVTVTSAFFDLGQGNVVIMLAVAVTKAILVVLYFMHVRWADRLTWVVVGSGFVWLAVMIAFTLSDELTRGLLG